MCALVTGLPSPSAHRIWYDTGTCSPVPWGTVQLIDYLHEMAGVAESISSGDLTVQFKPKGVQDRLGNAFEQMVAHLVGIVGQVVASSNQLGSASTQLASALLSEPSVQTTQP